MTTKRLVRRGWGFLEDKAGQHYAYLPGKSGKLGPFATCDEAAAAAAAYRPGDPLVETPSAVPPLRPVRQASLLDLLEPAT